MSTLPELQVQLDILLEQTRRAEHNLPHINLIDARFSFLALIRELSAQAAKVEALRDELRLCCKLKREYQKQVASKVDEVEALRADAERWHHVKACVRMDNHGGYVVHPDDPVDFVGIVATKFQREIDTERAARAALKERAPNN